MSNKNADAYWKANEQALRDVGRFEGPKGVVYQVFRDMEAKADPAPDFNLQHWLSSFAGAPWYAKQVGVHFDGAEGGAVWIDADDEAIAIRGPEAMRELAHMLLSFAEGYKDLEREQQE